MAVLASLCSYGLATNEDLEVSTQLNPQRYRPTLAKLISLITGLLLATLLGCATSPTGLTQFILISPDAAIIESETAYLDTVQQL